MDKLYSAWSFYAGPVLTLPLLAFFGTWRSRRTRIFLFLAAPVAVASLMVPFFQPHYLAPATALLYAVLLQGMRALIRHMPQVVRAIPLICIAMVGVRLAQAVISIPPDLTHTKTWARSSDELLSRELIAADLLAKGGQHLVIVHYGPEHDSRLEYVYNDADIDASRIVWARDMGRDRNAELLRYFSSRRVWLLEGESELVLSPYP